MKKVIIIFIAITFIASVCNGQDTDNFLKAVAERNIEEITSFLEKGIDVNVRDKEDRTALIIASMYNYKDVVQLLLNAKANLDMQNDVGATALTMASDEPAYEDILKLLLNAGADPNIRNIVNFTALMRASFYDCYVCAELLLNAGADPDTQTSEGETALILALTNRNLDIAKLLLKSGADPNLQTSDGETALTIAERENNMNDNNNGEYDEIIELLLNAGATYGYDDDYEDDDDDSDFEVYDENETALIYAVREGNEDEVKRLLNAGINPVTDALTIALRKGYKNMVEMIIDARKRMDKDMIDDFMLYALEEAVERGNLDMVEFLLKLGADPYYRILDTDDTPLLRAARNGYKEIVEMLIHAPSKSMNEAKKEYPDYDISLKDHYSIVLKEASEYGYTAIAELLLNAGADPDYDVYYSDNKTTLMIATENGHKEIVELLLNAGADPNAKVEDDDKTVLAIAYQNGHKDILEMLLKAGVNPNTEAYIYGSPTILMDASRRGKQRDKEIVEMLLNAGADPDIRQQGEYETALMIAIEEGNKDIAELLLNAGANPNIQTRDGDFALEWAAAMGDKDMVDMLLTHGADPNLKTPDRITALMMAAQNGHKDAVAMLLNAKADPNVKAFTKNNSTALIRASQHGDNAVVEMLLKAGANPNVQAFEDGNSALITASEQGRADMVQTLLNAKANPHLKNSDAKTALALATENGHTEIVKLLKKVEKKFPKKNKNNATQDEEEYQEYKMEKLLEFMRDFQFSM